MAQLRILPPAAKFIKKIKDKKLKLLIIVGTHSKIIHLSAVINKLRK